MQFSQQNDVIGANASTRQLSIVTKVYAWMFSALAVTGITAFICASNVAFMQWLYSGGSTVWILLFVQLGLAIYFTARLDKMSFTTAKVLFMVYALLMGITLSSIFIVYTMSSIATTFFICAAMYGIMAAYGHFTKKDLTSWGRILMMALIGLILASVVNIFLASSNIDWICSIVGVVLFSALTAYDTNKIRKLAYMNEDETTAKLAVLGAFSLYLDFINLFLYLLRFFGNRND